MAELPESLRVQVEERAGGRCEYCLSPREFDSSDFSLDHIVPRSRGGSDEFDNLAYCCQGCNSRKFTAIRAPDPVTGDEVPLFHPRENLWKDHFVWSEDGLEIVGITPTGRATRSRLQLNRLGLKNLRRALLVLGEHPR